jgi:hypothetical protein
MGVLLSKADVSAFGASGVELQLSTELDVHSFPAYHLRPAQFVWVFSTCNYERSW